MMYQSVICADRSLCDRRVSVALAFASLAGLDDSLHTHCIHSWDINYITAAS